MTTKTKQTMTKELKQWIEKQKPTIYDIKNYTTEDAPCFFSKDTMRFFKQTMKSFSVYKIDFNKWLIVAGKTQRIFSFTDYNIGELNFIEEEA